MNERRWNLLAACMVSAVGLVMAGMTIGSWWAMVGLSIAAFGFYGSKGPFWSMPPMFMTGAAAAASIAWINSLGNLGGFFGPWYVGVVKDWSGSYRGRALWAGLPLRDVGGGLRAVPAHPEPEPEGSRPAQSPLLLTIEERRPVSGAAAGRNPLDPREYFSPGGRLASRVRVA